MNTSTQSKNKHGTKNSQPGKSYPSIPEVRALLSRIASGWGQRAGVKHSELDFDFDPDSDDFLVRLLPFKDHPLFEAADDSMKKKVLSCGWLAYNEKTVAIETLIVSPSCMDMLDEKIPGADDEVSKQIICETLVDEAYHLLLVKNANRVTRVERGLEKLVVPQFNLVTLMAAHKEQCPEEWKKSLTQLAATVVSEIFISDYLNLLADDKTIQPFNRATVAAHRYDELAHGQIFKCLTKCIYSMLNHEQQAFFAEVLPKPVLWFANPELEIWLSMLEQIGFPNAQAMIKDCEWLHRTSLERLDYSGITALAEEIGILDTHIGRESFVAHGLLN